MESRILPEIDQKLCDGCGRCLDACAVKALALWDGKAVLARPESCQYDGECELACPATAIQVPYTIVFGDE